MAATTTTFSARPGFFETVILGGAVVGVLDGLDAVIFYRISDSVPPEKILQGIASGVLGMKSFQFGWVTVVLGTALHFLIAFGAATVYYVACLKLPALLRSPLLFGPAFGLAVYAFMYGVVLPLSAFPLQPSGTSGAGLVDELLAHILLVGLPLALLASRSAHIQPAAEAPLAEVSPPEISPYFPSAQGK